MKSSYYCSMCEKIHQLSSKVGEKHQIYNIQRKIKIVIEKYEDYYVAYPLGINGAVAGQGDTYEEAFDDLKKGLKTLINYMIEEGLPIFEDEEVKEAYAV